MSKDDYKSDLDGSANISTVAWGTFFGVVAIVIILWGLNWYFLAGTENGGTFGDSFGMVNALFSGLAFTGVIFAIFLQRKELQLQRRELEMTRQELAGQKDALTNQNQTMEHQNFNNTFFQLLRLHNDMLNSMDIQERKGKKVILRGRDCFAEFRNQLAALWDKARPELRGNSDLDRINLTYLKFFGGRQSDLGHYFRTLYNIVKFIHNSQVEDKRLYTNLVRAQLSSNELLLLFYNCLSEMGRDKFKPFIEDYALLKSLPKKTLLNPPDHSEHYSPSAFGD